ncbi:MAG: DUF1727 domain-containing protein [Firmicutes bacterium]|nr:DUF1727 domain-containing protein [Bacillota bacterium]
MQRRSMWTNLRFVVALILAKLAGFFSRRLGRGGGTTLPGRLALRICPEVLEILASQLSDGVVLITGTNGKTTTTKMVHTVLQAAGYQVAYNVSGANLTSGVASTLLAAASWSGKLRQDMGLFETDERAFPRVLAATRPRVVVVTNFFRDQLDRYGEVDHTVRLVHQALTRLGPQSRVLLNADDPLVAGLAEGLSAQVLFFGQEAEGAGPREGVVHPLQQVMDAHFCPHCGSPLKYDQVYYGHMGRYHCPQCGARRPDPAVALLTGIPSAPPAPVEDQDGLPLTIRTPEGLLRIQLRLPGSYNAYNALAAVAAAYVLGVPAPLIPEALGAMRSAFGRMEEIQLAGRRTLMILVKNPTGFNEVLASLLQRRTAKVLVIAINDLTADGEDVSWLWDVDFEALAASGQAARVVASGLRAYDMAVRLKYAGLDESRLEVVPDLGAALRRGLALAEELTGPAREGLPAPRAVAAAAGGPDGTLHPGRGGGPQAGPEAPGPRVEPGALFPMDERLYVLPTYTAMLALRHQLEEQKLVGRFWQET